MAAISSANNIDFEQIHDGHHALSVKNRQGIDNETLIFRKFDRLNARNLLHLQSQLVQLEGEIEKLDNEARKGPDHDDSKASLEAENPENLTLESSVSGKSHLHKANELAVKIKEYYEALLLQSRIANLSADGSAISKLDDVISRDIEQENAQNTGSLISRRFNETSNKPEDLVALQQTTVIDHLSKPVQHQEAAPKHSLPDVLYKTILDVAQQIKWNGIAVSMLYSAVLSIIAIASISIVISSSAKLGLAAAYTVIFALSTAILANANRAEIFGAAAAYAAVLVVFISGNSGRLQSGQGIVQLGVGFLKAVHCPVEDISS